MSDWCTTDYVLQGPVEKIEKFNNDLTQLWNKAQQQESEEAPSHTHALPLEAIQRGLLSHLYDSSATIRGTLTDYNGNIQATTAQNAFIRLTTETLWCPCYELMLQLALTYHLQLYYYAEEPNSSLYETNDSEGTFFPIRYKLSSEERNDYFVTFEELAQAVEQVTGTYTEQEDELIDAVDEYNANTGYLSVNAIQVV